MIGISLLVAMQKPKIAADARTNPDDYGGLYRAVRAGDLKKVQNMLGRGMDIERTYMDGESLLMAAAATNSLAMVRFLVDRGAKVDRSDSFGCTAFSMAAFDFGPAADYLLKHGAKMDGAPGGRPPIVDAADRGKLANVRRLLDLGAKIDAREPFNGETALMKASYRKNYPILRLLLDRGANPTLVSRKGKSALGLAREVKASQIVAALREHSGSRK